MCATHAASGQTNAANKSAVGTWKLDVAQSQLEPEPAPKSLTLTIIRESPSMGSWRVEEVDAKGQTASFSWSGPEDGTMHPIKGADGTELGKENLKREPGGALLRHGEIPSDGSSFDGRATLSEDGNTITDVVIAKAKDGKITKTTFVLRRVNAAK